MCASICSQNGIKESGASAVLENSIGKLVMNVNAKNSICPGKINAKPKLILAIVVVISSTIAIKR